MIHFQSDTKHQIIGKKHDDMAKVVAVLGYLTIFGWLIALFLYGNHKSPLARHHLRQSIGLTITAALLSFIPLIGWLLNIGVFIGWCIGVYSALCGHKTPLPLLGDFYQEHLDFIS